MAELVAAVAASHAPLITAAPETAEAGQRERVYAAMAALRGTFSQRFPELSLSELNMKVLAYFTPVRMESQ